MANCWVMVDPPPFKFPVTTPLKTRPSALMSIPECSKKRSSSVAIKALIKGFGI